MCAGPRLLKIKRQRSSTFTLLLISRSYWFDKPRFIIEGKLMLATSTPSLGAPPNSSSVAIIRPFGITISIIITSYLLVYFILEHYCNVVLSYFSCSKIMRRRTRGPNKGVKYTQRDAKFPTLNKIPKKNHTIK